MEFCPGTGKEGIREFRMVTGTGGGFGDPRERETKLIEADIRNGYLTYEQANEVYEYQSRIS